MSSFLKMFSQWITAPAIYALWESPSAVTSVWPCVKNKIHRRHCSVPELGHKEPWSFCLGLLKHTERNQPPNIKSSSLETAICEEAKLAVWRDHAERVCYGSFRCSTNGCFKVLHFEVVSSTHQWMTQTLMFISNNLYVNNHRDKTYI